MTDKEKLEKISQEYKEFLRIVSHDLSAPVRHLEAFIPILLDEVKDNINEDAQETVLFINKSLERLKAMQTALLTLSRIVINEEMPQKVDSSALINTALERLQNIITQSLPKIEYQNMPFISVPLIQFETVFFHLIENALIYHKDNKNITIGIHAKTVDNNIIFTIQDNGIGIIETQKDNIFDMFRRLHGESQYGGRVGAGLTIVKSIIEKNNGKIWIESDGKSGTAVKFSIPHKVH